MTEFIIVSPGNRARRILAAHRNYVDLIDKGVFQHDRARAAAKLQSKVVPAIGEQMLEIIKKSFR